MTIAVTSEKTSETTGPEAGQKQVVGSTAERILDSAHKLYLVGQADKVSMDSLAKAAGVGRATLYRHFKNRDELLLSLMVREAKGLAAGVVQQLQGFNDPAEYIIEGVVLAADVVSSSSLFAAILIDGGLDRWLLMSDRLLAVGMEIIVPVVEGAGLPAAEAEDFDLEALMEWIFRILVSLMTMPSSRTQSPEATRQLLQKMLLPVLKSS